MNIYLLKKRYGRVIEDISKNISKAGNKNKIALIGLTLQKITFYLIALRKNGYPSNSVGLNKYDYYLILQTNPYNNNDIYHLEFQITFPININIELSPEILYKFFATKKFCINDIISGRQTNLVGKIIEVNSGMDILTKVWMKIEKNILFKEINFNERKKIFYYLGESNQKYLFLKKMSKDIINQSFQIVRLSLRGGNDDDLKKLKIGTEFTIQDSGLDDFNLREGLVYEVFAFDGDERQNFQFDNIENLICFYYKGKYYDKKCFDNSSTNKKLEYI